MKPHKKNSWNLSLQRIAQSKCYENRSSSWYSFLRYNPSSPKKTGIYIVILALYTDFGTYLSLTKTETWMKYAIF
jgi:hypothetical protein